MEGDANEIQKRRASPDKICNLNTQEFSEIVDLDVFVDKSLFIKAFLEDEEKVIALLAPRRFGKSTNMSMLREFLNGNRKLFEDHQLKIWKEKRKFFDKHCHKNPVLHLDFKYVGGKTKYQLLESLRKLISSKFDQHSYVVVKSDGQYSWSKTGMEKMIPIKSFEKYWKNPKNLSENGVIDGLMHLIHCLHVYYGKPVYVLLDNCDNPITKIIMERGTTIEIVDEIAHAMNKLMNPLFKNNRDLKKALLTGCTRVAQAFSCYANNIKWYEFLKWRSFSSYYGFTDKEVNSLFEKEKFAPFKHENIRKWYDGYKVAKTDNYKIYNCLSIPSYLKQSMNSSKPEFQNYWATSSGVMDRLDGLFAQRLIYERVGNLIAGKDVTINIISKFHSKHIFVLKALVYNEIRFMTDALADFFLQFLTDQGYFNFKSVMGENSTIRIPNDEIRELMADKCYNLEFYEKKYRLSPDNIANYKYTLISLLERSDKEAFQKYADAISRLFDGAIMPRCEPEFQSILFTCTYNLRKLKEYGCEVSIIFKNILGSGRPYRLDVVVIRNNIGMILELKFAAKSSEVAYNQIIGRNYERAFGKYKNLTKKILIGVNMKKKNEVSLTYSVDDLAIETVSSVSRND